MIKEIRNKQKSKCKIYEKPLLIKEKYNYQINKSKAELVQALIQ